MLYNKAWENPATDTTDPVALLRRAADLMEQYGNAKRVFMVNDEEMTHLGPIGSMCIQGALVAALGVEPTTENSWQVRTENAAFRSAMYMMSKGLGVSSTNSVIQWNNNQFTTKDEIVAKMREVADAYEPVLMRING
jgi:hypothetical protein